MHSALNLPSGRLMAADDSTGDDGPKVGIAVAVAGPNPERAKEIFEALAEGGEVTMPFAATFWSKGFGACTDRFGVPWMVDTAEDA
jgi:PhnB protein